MDVIDSLSAILIAVHYYAKPFLAALFHGEALGGKENVPGQGFVIFREVIEGADRLLRDHQK